ncbi:hypothetical protein [Kitasatospora purpeofusca]|uniref:hypothetical protein n=1 Tax=Kitasatospora purpeofusca TaxID=67352 RepID=UPI00224FAF8C|nr:hypothetical protein [Kitasatospora purpeofusca]MCX4757104.1 hypothetical protein [Kitasatospora purpeofusca]WSR35134.1 hypothetical protein OG715_31765 [Kitasatospora purpeofusca]WSR43454.1 hypothetical protein OG196_32795 [Kitasatospora purpeofusca]
MNPETGTVEFDVPAVFEEFRATDDPEEAYELVLDRLGERAAELGADRRRALTDLHLTGSAALGELDALWSGTCVGTLDGQLSTATLTVARLDTADPAPQEAVAAALAEILAPAPGTAVGSGHRRPVRRFEAPAGPVVVALEQTPGWQLGGGRSVPLLSAKAHLPLPPPLPGVLIVELTTPDVDHWTDGYAPLLVAVLRSVRFGMPGSADTPAGPAAPAGGIGPVASGGNGPGTPGTDPFGTVLV